MPKIFSVYDSKTSSYSPPMNFPHTGDAIRSFSEIANDKSSTTIGKYPADFTLFELGSFDLQTAKFDLYSTPVAYGVALEYVKQE